MRVKAPGQRQHQKQRPGHIILYPWAGTGCTGQRGPRERAGWEGASGGKPWTPACRLPFTLWPQSTFRSYWAAETPNELRLRKLILAILLPFKTGNKISLYLHFSLTHSILPLFGNPSNLFFLFQINFLALQMEAIEFPTSTARI